MNKGTKESKAERQRRYRAKQKAAGLCTRCNHPKSNHTNGCLLAHANKSKLWRQRNRATVIERYGGRCACCGEANVDFLTIDHVNNDGHVELLTVHHTQIYSRLAKNNQILSGYQLLCWNCNCSKQIFGTCYHQLSKAPKSTTRSRWQFKLKTDVLVNYGRSCACCGLDEIWFLTIDHINGGGTAHKKLIGTNNSVTFYSWLKRECYPPGYQTLCFNCNCASAIYETCPHRSTTCRLLMCQGVGL